MTPPFMAASGGAPWATLGAALAIGVAFGWMLERAGLGSAKKLIGQFYLTDLAVFKVMFSAIVTAMLGMFWLHHLGLLDLSAIDVPATFLWPQAVGGFIFGAGFALAGLCPGTSCVAAASGRLDGAAVVAGMFAGVLLTGIVLGPVQWFQSFFDRGSRGVYTLPDLLQVRSGLVVAGVVLVALAGFGTAEWIERRSR